jgi:hypothetical protein
MEFLHASIAMLVSMVLVLAGVVGYMYFQQARLFQNMNAIAMVIGELNQNLMSVQVTEPAPVPVKVEPEPEVEDDRVSVEEEAPVATAEVVDGPPASLDTDDLEGKTKKELQDILTKRGIPYSKSDAKPTLLSLLKATA